MKFECSCEKLKQALGVAEKLTLKSEQAPILACVLIEAKGSTISIKATNLEAGVKIDISAKVEKEGVAAIQASTLNSLISNIKLDKTVLCMVEDGSLKIKTQHSKNSIKTLNSDDFPSIPEAVDETVITLNAQDLAQGLKDVVYSAAVSGIKPELSSVYIYPTDESLVFVATDSFRLAERRLSVKYQGSFEKILIPLKNTQELLRVIGDYKEEIKISLTKNQLAANVGNTYFVSRVLDGVFPDYQQIIPKTSTTEVIALKQDVIDALKLTHIFADKFNQVRFGVSVQDKKFEIYTKNTNLGENSSEVEATLEGQDIDIGFNQKYINDVLSNISADSIHFLFSGPQKPLIVKAAGRNDFLYLVMPMNR
jgi:DNA polymerase-3 subunit beta